MIPRPTLPAALSATTMLLQATSPASSALPLIVSGLLAFIGGMLLIIIGRVLSQGADTNRKVVDLTLSMAQIRNTLDGPMGLVNRFDRMHQERNREHEQKLAAEVMENAELRQQLKELGNRRGDG